MEDSKTLLEQIKDVISAQDQPIFELILTDKAAPETLADMMAARVLLFTEEQNEDPQV